MNILYEYNVIDELVVSPAWVCVCVCVAQTAIMCPIFIVMVNVFVCMTYEFCWNKQNQTCT